MVQILAEIELKSEISQSILNRFSCNFENFIRRYCGNFPESLVMFKRLLEKLLIYKSIETSIRNRLSCSFSGWIFSYICNCPENLVEFAQLFQKLLGCLDWLGRSPGVKHVIHGAKINLSTSSKLWFKYKPKFN